MIGWRSRRRVRSPGTAREQHQHLVHLRQAVMNARRKNKSHKACGPPACVSYFTYQSLQVPNVKLRPAQPSSSASSKRSDGRLHQPSNCSRNLVRHSSPDDEPENTFVDLCPRPFKGVVLCATGIQDKVRRFCHSGINVAP